jgi:hypothetical protein
MQADPVSPAIDLPPWTGEPCRELPPTAITRPDELMRTLIRSDFCFGMDIVQTLNRSIARKLRGGELHEYPNGHFVVTLWLAYLFNERMEPDEGDPAPRGRSLARHGASVLMPGRSVDPRRSRTRIRLLRPALRLPLARVLPALPVPASLRSSMVARRRRPGRGQPELGRQLLNVCVRRSWHSSPVAMKKPTWQCKRKRRALMSAASCQLRA